MAGIFLFFFGIIPAFFFYFNVNYFIFFWRALLFLTFHFWLSTDNSHFISKILPLLLKALSRSWINLYFSSLPSNSYFYFLGVTSFYYWTGLILFYYSYYWLADSYFILLASFILFTIWILII